MKTRPLNFHPLPGMASSHLQMIAATFLPPGNPPPSQSLHIELGQGDRLSCEISTPAQWKQTDPTVALVHGMGGCHSSSYMIRMARKLYRRGIKAVRINLRGCGLGKGLSKLPYNGGTSGDMLKVLEVLKGQAPASEITLIGFSLGGNIILKLAGELGAEAPQWVKAFIAVCPPLDLAEAVQTIQEKRNRLYHAYYLKRIIEQSRPWNPPKVRTLYAFDDAITGPLWGYAGADDYYRACSSARFIPKIQQTTHLLFAKDDPFIRLDRLQGLAVPESVQLWAAERGGHMGFLGKTPGGRSLYWMDYLLLNWIEGDFQSDSSSSEHKF